tara:strand:- start:1587 stop:2600 length:1014 start_codon:yes stop_codon:yes gene_type:complete
MKKIKVNKLIYSLIVSISGLLLSLFVNRGYFIIESVVGTEYKNIMSSEKIENYGRLGHRLLTPFLSKIFDDIFVFNILVLAIWLFYITFNLYDKYEESTLLLLIFSITSSQIIIFTLNFAYYPDPLTILLTTIALFNIENNYLFTFLGFLNLINNEVGLFILLFLVFVSKKRVTKMQLLILVIFLYLIYRQIISMYVQNDSSGISTYILELGNFDLNFFMLFGLFSGLKFLSLFLISTKKPFTIFIFLIFYILVPLNMAVDYTRYGTLLIVVILWVLNNNSFKFNRNLKMIALLVLILNIITPKYYIWGDQLTYLRDSKLHLFDITGKNFEERSINK